MITTLIVNKLEPSKLLENTRLVLQYACRSSVSAELVSPVWRPLRPPVDATKSILIKKADLTKVASDLLAST